MSIEPPAESPTIDFTYDQWLAYHWSRLTHGDHQMKGVSPYQVVELERNAARSELKATRLQLQQLHQQANTVIQQLQAQHHQQTIFLAAVIHTLGGSLLVPHASFDAVRARPHRFQEDVDDDTKATRIALVPLTDDEVQTLRQPPAADVVEQPSDTPAVEVEHPRIELVSR